MLFFPAAADPDDALEGSGAAEGHHYGAGQRGLQSGLGLGGGRPQRRRERGATRDYKDRGTVGGGRAMNQSQSKQGLDN